MELIHCPRTASSFAAVLRSFLNPSGRPLLSRALWDEASSDGLRKSNLSIPRPVFTTASRFASFSFDRETTYKDEHQASGWTLLRSAFTRAEVRKSISPLPPHLSRGLMYFFFFFSYGPSRRREGNPERSAGRECPTATGSPTTRVELEGSSWPSLFHLWTPSCSSYAMNLRRWCTRRWRPSEESQPGPGCRRRGLHATIQSRYPLQFKISAIQSVHMDAWFRKVLLCLDRSRELGQPKVRLGQLVFPWQ